MWELIKIWKFEFKIKDKLQITHLKFRGVWILHPEVSEFGSYPLKFEGVWILHLDILKFGFYSLNFRGFSILLPKVWSVWILHLEVLEFGGVNS